MILASESSDGPGRKRKFPSIKEFAKAGGEKMKRKIALIKYWKKLIELDLYRVKKIIGMDVIIKNEKMVYTLKWRTRKIYKTSNKSFKVVG